MARARQDSSSISPFCGNRNFISWNGPMNSAASISPSFSACADLAEWQGNHFCAGGFQGLTSEAADPNLKALKVANRIDLFIKPTTHLATSIAEREKLTTDFGVNALSASSCPPPNSNHAFCSCAVSPKGIL